MLSTLPSMQDAVLWRGLGKSPDLADLAEDHRMSEAPQLLSLHSPIRKAHRSNPRPGQAQTDA